MLAANKRTQVRPEAKQVGEASDVRVGSYQTPSHRFYPNICSITSGQYSLAVPDISFPADPPRTTAVLFPDCSNAVRFKFKNYDW